MLSSKSGWYLPFMVLASTILLYGLIGLWFTQWSASGYYARPLNALDGIVSPNTLDAIYEDTRLRETILSLTERIAKASSDFGEAYDLASLKGLGKNITEEIEQLKARYVPTGKVKRQGFLSSLIPGRDGGKGSGGGLLGGLLGGGGGGNSTGGLLGGLLGGGGGGNSTGGLADLFGQAISGLGNNVVGSLATPAFFLGIGIGMGTGTGLNLTNKGEAEAIATRVASTMDMQLTGGNLVARNLGSGLSGQLVPALGGLATDVPIGMAAFALAQGIGQGSASGLNLTQQKFEPKNGSDLMTIAGNLGLGVSMPIASSIDTQQLLGQAGGQLMAQIPQIAMVAGQGLGNGAVKGLGLGKGANATLGSLLGKRQAPADPGLAAITGAVGNFTFGLSESFLQSANLGKLIDPNAFNLNLGGNTILSFASGAGKGLGEGIAIGFNVTNGTTTSPQPEVTGIDRNKEQLAKELVKGIAAGFLQNGGASAARNILSSSTGGLTNSIVFAQVAEGAARGIVEGAVHGLSQAGGLRNVLSGNFSKDLPMNLPSLPPSSFNDSINGSAVSFTRGLSGEGLLLFSQFLNGGKGNSQPPAKRSVDAMGVVPYGLASRQEATSTPALAIDSGTLQGLAQVGINTLTCPGFGGAVAVAWGIMDSLKIDGRKVINEQLDGSTLVALPKDPITITSGGNAFVVNIQEQSIKINERALRPFAVILGLHIFFITLAFFFILPIYLVMGALMRISVMIKIPFDEGKNKKWRGILLIYLFFPFALVGFVLGFVAMGSSKHLRTAHGILGLIVLLFTIPTVIVSFFRLRTSTPQPGPSAFRDIKQFPALLKGPQKVHVYSGALVQLTLTFGVISWVEGWNDFRSISLCIIDAVLTARIMVGLTNVLVFLQISVIGILALRQYLEIRIAKLEAQGAKAGVEIEKGTRNIGPDTIKIFGFDTTPLPLRSSPDQFQIRNAARVASIHGYEDPKIGWPSQARRLGEADTLPLPARSISRDSVISSLAPSTPSPRIYNPKLGGFEDDRSFIIAPPPPRLPTVLGNTATVSEFGDIRPSPSIVPENRRPSMAMQTRLLGEGLGGKGENISR
ncbi:hypothetical protein GQ44DRAFT_779310 [Phaeosphaeriaceae sp. PMI808]|nr:hypothetical protein GQ44DRAFT_779310 [Phaeosphaeriaceae sp. PMI808]